MSEFAVLYSSVTGNTEKIAAAIYQAIPSNSKDICKINESLTADFANNYFIGFNVEKGSSPELITAFIKQLHRKNIALFGTCGHSSKQSYYQLIESRTANLLSSDNNYLGCFLCQGKMPISERNSYKEMLMKEPNNYVIINLIKNFDIAMLHPNQEDEKNAVEFTKKAIQKLNK